MLVPIVSMLCGLIDRCDKTNDSFGEDPVEYRISYNPVPEPRKRMRKSKRKNKAD